MLSVDTDERSSVFHKMSNSAFAGSFSQRSVTSGEVSSTGLGNKEIPQTSDHASNRVRQDSENHSNAIPSSGEAVAENAIDKINDYEDEFGNKRYDLLEIQPIKYEYLDHTADVQLHAWGANLREALEQVAMAMFGYMTDIDAVEMLEEKSVTAEAEDLNGLLFHFLDEWLYVFSSEPYFIPRRIDVEEFHREGANFVIRAKGYGEPFDLSKHPQGTEVKAITYSNMQIHDNPGHVDIFVIIDI